MSPQDQISEMRGTNDTLILPSLYGSIALCALILLSIWYLSSWHRLRHIPGPFLNSLSILPMQHMTRGGKLSFMLKDLGDKYGKTLKRTSRSRPTLSQAL